MSKRLSARESEPAMIRGVVVAVLGLLTTLGVSWAAELDKDTIGAIVTVLVVLVPLAQALWTRFAVTANRKIVSRVTSRGTVVAGDAAAAPTGRPLEVVDTGATPAVAPVRIDPSLVDPAYVRG